MKILSGLLQKEKRREEKKEDYWIIPSYKETSGEPIQYRSSEGIQIQISKNLYSLEEPTLNEQEQEKYLLIKKGFYEIITTEQTKDPEEYLKKLLLLITAELNLRLTQESFNKILYHAKKEFLGFGKIEALLEDPLIEIILIEGETVTIKQKLYGKLQTNISLKEEELQQIMQRALLSCKKELTGKESRIECKNEMGNWDILPTKKMLRLEKKQEKFLSPKELLQQRKVSPEMLAYLWMLIEEKKNIFILQNTDLIYTLSFFLPAHKSIKVDTKEFPPYELGETILGESIIQADWTLNLRKEAEEKKEGQITKIEEHIPEQGNIICDTEEGIVKSIKESGKEIFAYKENKFLFSFKESFFFAAKENRKEECKQRTKLIISLIKNKLNDRDFKKVIAAYYENPMYVMKKVGIQ